MNKLSCMLKEQPASNNIFTVLLVLQHQGRHFSSGLLFVHHVNKLMVLWAVAVCVAACHRAMFGMKTSNPPFLLFLSLSGSLIHSSQPLFIKSCQSSLSHWGFDCGSAVRNETPRLSAKRFISQCCSQSDRAPIALSYSLQHKHIYGQVKMPLMLWQ